MSTTPTQQPIWVALALSNITKRKHAIWLIISSIVFTIGFAVWWLAFGGDWDWFAWTVPLPIWYWVAMLWMDKNAAWES
jgi:hypothetical protein